MAEQEANDPAQEELTRPARIVLDVREDIYILGTEGMRDMVNTFEDEFPEANIRSSLQEDLTLNKAGIIICYNAVPGKHEQVFTNRTLLAMTLFLNQLSLRGMMDKVDLVRVSGSMAKIMEGITALGRGKRPPLISEKESQISGKKGGGGRTFGSGSHVPS